MKITEKDLKILLENMIMKSEKLIKNTIKNMKNIK